MKEFKRGLERRAAKAIRVGKSGGQEVFTAVKYLYHTVVHVIRLENSRRRTSQQRTQKFRLLSPDLQLTAGGPPKITCAVFEFAVAVKSRGINR